MRMMWISMIAAAAVACTFAPAFAGGHDAVCKDALLSRQEQSLCSEQMAQAQSVDEQKKLESKYRDRVAKRKQEQQK
jgi:hypothetical protein